jgi:sigma-E factor negative regulatory protein RseB
MRAGARPGSSRLLAGAVAALLSAGAAADDSAVEWLVRMGEAARTQNYQGILVYRDADMLETLRLVHRHSNGQERERLVSLSGTPREILRQNEQVTCLLPKQEQLTAGNAGQHGLFPHMTRETVEKLSEHYEVRLIGRARVAGRLCRGVAIKPRDAFRYGYQFWGDDKTGVPLKVTLTAPDNSRVEELVFTQVEFPKRIPDSALGPEGGVKKSGSAQPVSMTRTEAPKLPPSRWELQQLPPGFKLTMRDVKPLPDRRGELEHLLVSDGLSAVSIFIANQPPPERLFQGFSHMGAVHAYGRMVGDYHVAVVGEVPMETVRLIGDGLRASDELSPARMNLIPPTP